MTGTFSESKIVTLQTPSLIYVFYFLTILAMEVRRVLPDQPNIIFPDPANSPEWMYGSKTGFTLPIQPTAGNEIKV